MAWIKVEHALPDKPEVMGMAERLGIDQDAVVGKLFRLWIWADQQTIDGCAPSVTRASLDRLVCCAGFTDALESVGWIRIEEGRLVFVNFDRHNGETAKQRALAAKRMSNSRKKPAAKSCAPSATTASPREEKEKSKNSSPPPSPSKASERLGEGSALGSEFFGPSGEWPESGAARELLDRWSKTPGAQPAPRNLSHALQRKLAERLTDPAWRWRDALAKFPLPFFSDSGGMGLAKFLNGDTVDTVLQGSYFFTKGRNGHNRTPGPGQKYDPTAQLDPL